jgi:hypothetical protein
MALAPSFDEVYGTIEEERKGLQTQILELETSDCWIEFHT